MITEIEASEIPTLLIQHSNYMGQAKTSFQACKICAFL